MNGWHCPCDAPLDFISRRCRHCRRPAVYVPEQDRMRPLEQEDRACANRQHGCNWRADENGTLCFSCALTRLIPPQKDPESFATWRRFERAKRHLTASLMRLKLLPRHAVLGGRRLEINLLQDQRDNPEVVEEIVYTGHLDGVISINAREADPLQVERARLHFNEKYRTLLGSLRHETGHYFWQALVAKNEPRLAAFRGLFGDERADYDEAKAAYYAAQPGEHPAFVSEYARMHPHEDWAETWMHYLHMESGIAVAKRAGMIFAREGADFADLLPRWRQVAEIANALSTALGHRPSYPFYTAEQALPKLRFVHDIIHEEKLAAEKERGQTHQE